MGAHIIPPRLREVMPKSEGGSLALARGALSLFRGVKAKRGVAQSPIFFYLRLADAEFAADRREKFIIAAFACVYLSPDMLPTFAD